MPTYGTLHITPVLCSSKSFATFFRWHCFLMPRRAAGPYSTMSSRIVHEAMIDLIGNAKFALRCPISTFLQVCFREYFIETQNSLGDRTLPTLRSLFRTFQSVSWDIRKLNDIEDLKSFLSRERCKQVRAVLAYACDERGVTPSEDGDVRVLVDLRRKLLKRSRES
jgi:hypothetical protein